MLFSFSFAVLFQKLNSEYGQLGKDRHIAECYEDLLQCKKREDRVGGRGGGGKGVMEYRNAGAGVIGTQHPH